MWYLVIISRLITFEPRWYPCSWWMELALFRQGRRFRRIQRDGGMVRISERRVSINDFSTGKSVVFKQNPHKEKVSQIFAATGEARATWYYVLQKEDAPKNPL